MKDSEKSCGVVEQLLVSPSLPSPQGTRNSIFSRPRYENEEIKDSLLSFCTSTPHFNGPPHPKPRPPASGTPTRSASLRPTDPRCGLVIDPRYSCFCEGAPQGSRLAVGQGRVNERRLKNERKGRQQKQVPTHKLVRFRRNPTNKCWNSKVTEK